jgi:lauroyl/myristoyl acyltransferase
MRFLEVLLEEIVLWFIWFPVRKLIKPLPIKLNYFFALFLAFFFYWLNQKRRWGVIEEVKRLFGKRFNEKDIKRIVKASFIIFVKRQVENLLFGSFTKDELNQMAFIEGMDHLNKALQERKGVILLLSHFGSFLLPLPVLGYRGYKVIQVGGKPLLEGNSPVHRKIFEFRKNETDKLPIQFIQSDQYLRTLIRALNNNAVLVIAFDGRAGDKWIPVQLLNRTGYFSPGPFNLAIKTGAQILPTFVVRGKNNRHKIIFEPPMELEITNTKEETLKINTIKFAKIFEKYLLRYPCHFAMTLYSVRDEANKGFNRPLFID